MKRKKLITMVLTVIMLLVMSSFSVMASDPDGGNEEGQAVQWTTADFTYSEDGTTITGLTDSGVAKRTQTTVMTLPNKSDSGVVITEIGEGQAGGKGVFGSDDSTITEVILPNQLEVIGKNAFMNNNLTKVDFPETLKTIGQSAFQVNNLSDIILPDSVETVGPAAFLSNINIENVKISKSMTIIPDSFVANIGTEKAEKFTEISIPEGIKSIGRTAFSGHNFESVSIPASVESIGGNAFSQPIGVSRLKNVTLHEGLKSIDGYAFKQCVIETIDLPSTVTTLKKAAFSGNVPMVKVYVSNKEQLVKTSNFIIDGAGHKVVWKDSVELAAVKEVAKTDLENYKNMEAYDTLQQTEINNIISDTIIKFERCSDEESVNTAVVTAKASLDAVQTSKQVAATKAIQEATAAQAAATTEAEKAAADLALAQANQSMAEANLEATIAIKEKAEEARDAAIAAKNEAEAEKAVALAEKAEAIARAELAEANAATAEAEKVAAEAAQKAAEDKALESEKQAAEAEKKATEAQNAQKAAEEKVAATNDKYSAPESVQNLKVKAGKKKAVLTWEKAENASGYRIYRATSKDGKYKLVKTVKGADTVKYVNKKLKSGKKYYYKVRAYKKVPSGKIFSKATEAKKVKVK